MKGQGRTARSIRAERKRQEAVSGCRHFGEPTGETYKLKCENCRGNVRIKHAIHVCDIWITCLPIAQDTNKLDIMTCRRCQVEKLGYEL
jgi:hypothetical protein